MGEEMKINETEQVIMSEENRKHFKNNVQPKKMMQSTSNDPMPSMDMLQRHHIRKIKHNIKNENNVDGEQKVVE